MDASESERARRRTPTPTPPSEAVGESGDKEARRAADEAVVGEGREAHARRTPDADEGGAPAAGKKRH
ncbi:hypothetical protein ABZY44_04115 [Streptomyces sp. NPDC006544]|uniref:hypothetical protein n=1 Tax=Streptomyces sp. NPDC006544 TaxID=3154583 RepID=UPI0033B1E904